MDFCFPNRVLLLFSFDHDGFLTFRKMKSNMAVLRILSNTRSSFHVTDFIGNIFERASNPPICIVMVLILQEGPKSPLAPPLFCPIEDQN